MQFECPGLVHESLFTFIRTGGRIMMDIGRSIFWTIRGPQYKMIDLSINFCELSAYLPMFRGLNYTPNPEK